MDFQSWLVVGYATLGVLSALWILAFERRHYSDFPAFIRGQTLIMIVFVATCILLWPFLLIAWGTGSYKDL